MPTCSLVVPSSAPGAALHRTVNAGASKVAGDRRRRLLHALGGPANTAPFHRQPPIDRHQHATRPDSEAGQRCASRRH
jgi:hypothetical protein